MPGQRAACQLAELDEVAEAAQIKIRANAPTKSCYLDILPTWFLKDPAVLRALTSTLTHLVNRSLTTCELLGCLSEAVVTPLVKKPGLDPDVLGNYRPISNLQLIEKVLERGVAEQLSPHLDLYGLRDDFQSAYKPGYSTESALFKIKNDIDLALKQGEGLLLVLLDRSAAFDTIDHQIFLDRL